jgi:hypothetical protein
LDYKINKCATEDMSIHAWFNNFKFLAPTTTTPVVVKSLLNSLDEIALDEPAPTLVGTIMVKPPLPQNSSKLLLNIIYIKD